MSHFMDWVGTIQVSTTDRRRVVVDDLPEPWRAIVKRTQKAGFNPTLDKVQEVYQRNLRRAGRAL